VFGFVANLLYGLVPYLVWETLTDASPVPRGLAAGIGLAGGDRPRGHALRDRRRLGPHWLGFHPFTVLGSIVLVNNLVVALALGRSCSRCSIRASSARASSIGTSSGRASRRRARRCSSA
jgi:hypothetical protein